LGDLRLLCVLFVFCLQIKAFANPVEQDHLLYPADRDFLFISGIEDTVSKYAVKKAIERCDSGKTKDTDGPFCQAAKGFRDPSLNFSDLPWSDLQAQVLFFGERHFDQEIKYYLRDNLENLKKLGITTIGFEMLNSKNQPVVDAYMNGETDMQPLKTAFEKDWAYESAGYFALIEAAKAAGLRVLALDDREGAKDIPLFFDQLRARDAHMAANIDREISQSPNRKVAVLSGRLHAVENFSIEGLTESMPSLLRKSYGISSISILEFNKTDGNGFNAMKKYLHGDLATGVLKLPADYAYADYILFFR
jgi:hypothetical protein